MTGSYLRATNGALKEKKGKLMLAATLMVPMMGKAKIISATLDQKTALRAAQPALAVVRSDEAPAETKSAKVVSSASIESARSEYIAAPAASVVSKLDEASAPNTHLVQRGETLFSISKRYGVTIETIKMLNAIKANQVQVGHNLLLNATATPVASLASAGLLRVNTPRQSAQRKPSTYIVRSGDTLYAIASKYAVEFDDLLRWNKLHTKSVLQPGHKIRMTM